MDMPDKPARPSSFVRRTVLMTPESVVGIYRIAAHRQTLTGRKRPFELVAGGLLDGAVVAEMGRLGLPPVVAEVDDG